MPNTKKTEKTAKPHKLTAEEIAAICAEAADNGKAANIIRLKLVGISDVADYVVLCTATSEPHVNAIAERIQRSLRNDYAIRPLHLDGTPKSHWMIVDYGAVVAHVMTEETRELYQLESLWGDAPRVEAVKKLTVAAKKLRKETKAKE